MSDHPRVLLLTNSLAVGGAETQFVRLALHLHANGHPVRVATILPDGRGLRGLEAAGIHHEVLPLQAPVSGITALAGAIRLFLRWRPDVVISFLFYANVLGRLAAAVTRVPVVICSVRNERFGGRINDAALRLTDRLATVTVTNSTNAAARLAADRIVNEDRLLVIPNGVPLEQFEGHPDRGAARRALGALDQDFLWLAIGRLEPQKDYPTLLRAMETLRDAGQRAQLRIAGGGSQRAALDVSISGLGLSAIVKTLGVRHDVPVLLDAADALVLTSLWEGLPNVIIEAMAAAVPVVTTNCGGAPELVEHGVTGLLVPPGDPPALATAMAALMRLSVARRREMGEAGRRFVAERFAVDRIMTCWQELIRVLTQATSEARNRVPDDAGRRVV